MILFILATLPLFLSRTLGYNSGQLHPFELQSYTPFSILSHITYTNPLFSMATIIQEAHNGWHAGEQAVHKLLKVPTSSRENPTNSGLPPSYARRVAISPLVALGALDDQGRPWTTIWGGERGFIRPVAHSVLGLQSIVDKGNDPVLKSLLNGIPDGEVFQSDEGKPISALSIDLETRDRVKLAGKMVVGTVGGRPDSKSIGEVQMALHIQESLGNCPKYLNKKTIRPHIPAPELVSSTLPLSEEAVSLISQADMFFLSSTNNVSMDTNHRGGSPGFVRVLTNSATEGGVTLVYPEYSGNRLYQTLGNLHVNPLIGLAIPDYTTSSVLYITGTSSLLVNPEASRLLPHTKLAVKITVSSAIYVRDSLPFRGTPGELSPYNPPLRSTTGTSSTVSSSDRSTTGNAIASATLIARKTLTPSISKFTFYLKPERRGGGSSSADENMIIKPWQAAGHVTLDFGAELDLGYAHMNDNDPQALNDDYVRSFTVSSSPPPPSTITQIEKEGVQFEITARRTGGPVTGLMFKHDVKRTPLEVPVLGFGGGELAVFSELDKTKNKKTVFIAGGVGITPLLSQNLEEQGEDVEVIWSLRGEDLGLVQELSEGWRNSGRVKVFITGTVKDEEEIEKFKRMGIRVERRRVKKEDVLGLKGEKNGEMRWLLCAGEGMLKVLMGWLEGEGEVVVESFGY